MQNFFLQKNPSSKQSVKRENGAIVSFVAGSLECSEANQLRVPLLYVIQIHGIRKKTNFRRSGAEACRREAWIGAQWFCLLIRVLLHSSFISLVSRR